MKIDKEGNFSYQGANMTHEKILEFFKHLDFEQVNDKNYILKWESQGVVQKIKVVVEDTLFVVKDLVQDGGGILLLLNDDSKEELKKEEIKFENNIPYAMVKNERVRARFNRHAAFKLGQILTHEN